MLFHNFLESCLKRLKLGQWLKLLLQWRPSYSQQHEDDPRSVSLAFFAPPWLLSTHPEDSAHWHFVRLLQNVPRSPQDNWRSRGLHRHSICTTRTSEVQKRKTSQLFPWEGQKTGAALPLLVFTRVFPVKI